MEREGEAPLTDEEKAGVRSLASYFLATSRR